LQSPQQAAGALIIVGVEVTAGGVCVALGGSVLVGTDDGVDVGGGDGDGVAVADGTAVAATSENGGVKNSDRLTSGVTGSASTFAAGACGLHSSEFRFRHDRHMIWTNGPPGSPT